MILGRHESAVVDEVSDISVDLEAFDRDRAADPAEYPRAERNPGRRWPHGGRQLLCYRTFGHGGGAISCVVERGW